jgi:hypothetical protein
MAKTLKYKKTAVEQIQAYLKLIEDPFVGIAAAEEIRRELTKLTVDPRLGTAPTGPFEDRPIYPFRLSAGDKARLAQVSYHVGPDNIEILAFSCVPV